MVKRFFIAHREEKQYIVNLSDVAQIVKRLKKDRPTIPTYLQINRSNSIGSKSEGDSDTNDPDHPQ